MILSVHASTYLQYTCCTNRAGLLQMLRSMRGALQDRQRETEPSGFGHFTIAMEFTKHACRMMMTFDSTALQRMRCMRKAKCLTVYLLYHTRLSASCSLASSSLQYKAVSSYAAPHAVMKNA